MMEIAAYEGLVRNWRELAEELGVETAGMDRRVREEALIRAAFAAWGSDMGAHLNGQFAIVMRDGETGELFLTRDILGAELLFYYRTDDGRLLFGTRISDLFDQPGFGRALNRELIQFFLAFTYIPGEETLFEGVRKVEPGGWLRFRPVGAAGAGEPDGAGVQIGHFRELAFDPDESRSLDEWADAIEAAMDESMRCVVDEGEPCDSFLSGGVDSSYMLAKGPARCGHCVSYADQNASEEAEARETAGVLNREFDAMRVEPEEFFGTVDEFLRAYEQPSADAAGLAFYVACKKLAARVAAEEDTAGSAGSADAADAADAADVAESAPATPEDAAGEFEESASAPASAAARPRRVFFSGEGSDEFFGGYRAYTRAEEFRSNPDPVYFGATCIMHEDAQRRYLKDYCEERPTRDFMRERGAGGMKYDPVTWMLYTEARSYLEGSILFNSTKIAQGTGLDIRMPFLDLRLFDIACRMPSRFKVGEAGNKLALRRAAERVLPQHIAYRKKLGFPVPVRAWLADERWSTDIRRAFEGETAREFFVAEEIHALLDEFLGGNLALWHRVWTIYIFIRWYELLFGMLVRARSRAQDIGNPAFLYPSVRRAT